jgi:hypothetical protein
MNMIEVFTHLEERIDQLSGDWIKRNSNYEKGACQNLGFNYEAKRYWDCEFNGTYIEIKKGRSIWLDEVRYSEILLSEEIDNLECKEETITMFLIPSRDKERIDRIFLVDTKRIISFMNIDKEWAYRLLSRHKVTTRSLNCQQSMTIKDVENIANHIILSDKK